MTCLTTGCASYDLLVGPMGQVKAAVNPPNYTTSKHHPIDMGIIAVTQLAALQEEVSQRSCVDHGCGRSTVGLGEGAQNGDRHGRAGGG